jgi:nucleotide-binding universal stress UspA family protein
VADALSVSIEKEEKVELTDILVHLDHHAGASARLDVAAGLAKGHQARLTGLMVTRRHYPAMASVVAIREIFEKKVALAGLEGRWESVEDSGPMAGMAGLAGMASIIRSHALCSDLIVVGQGSRESAEAGVPFDLPESLVLVSGLPVLVVPYAGSFASVGERVLVAWKAGRESTRALNDAIPFLKRARQVEILTVDTAGTNDEDGGVISAELCTHLARHGVAAKALSLPGGDVPLADLFLNRVCDEGFDLLVTGAYAHGRDGRLELGPVARQLLREMTVPVLMSH